MTVCLAHRRGIALTADVASSDILTNFCQVVLIPLARNMCFTGADLYAGWRSTSPERLISSGGLPGICKGLGNKTRGRMGPVYIADPIGPGICKSIQTMAALGSHRL